MSAPEKMYTIVRTYKGYQIYHHYQDVEIKELIKNRNYEIEVTIYSHLEEAFFTIVKSDYFPVIQFYNNTHRSEIEYLKNEKTKHIEGIDRLKSELNLIDEKIKKLEETNN